MRSRNILVGMAVSLAVAACAETPEAPLSPPQVTEESGPSAPLFLAAQGKGVPNSYIVVMKPQSEASIAAAAAGVNPKRVFRHALNGFSAELTDDQVSALRRNPAVHFIEQDQIFSIDGTQVMDGNGDPWGLDRIDQENLPLSGDYTFFSNGNGVTAYIIDTGIRPGHLEFKRMGVSRAFIGFDSFGGNGRDCNGHGMHVAGIVGAKTYGVAKRVELQGVRVLDCQGSGNTTTLIDGINWVLQHHATNSTVAVANLSLAGPFSKAANVAVDIMDLAGIFPAVAAGNDDDYTCDYSPASALGAFTVAATDLLVAPPSSVPQAPAPGDFDIKAPFSNWGRCVDICAPGTAILSLWLNGGLAYASGTSQASPHVAGIVALLKQRKGDLSGVEVRRRLLDRAAYGKISNNDFQFYQYGTPDILLQKGGL